MPFDRAIARLIDHTILKPDATSDAVRQVCVEARHYEFASVCVNSYWVPFVASQIAGSPVLTCAVVGFPLGASDTKTKVHETMQAVHSGAREVDMVINIGALRSGDSGIVEADIRAVAQACHPGGAILKVIIETCLLTDEEKVLACQLAQHARADFVKTSTGFSTAGATVADVALMRRTVGPDMGVKASGGIRTLEALRAMVAAGATRVGASASVAIVEATTAKDPAPPRA